MSCVQLIECVHAGINDEITKAKSKINQER